MSAPAMDTPIIGTTPLPPVFFLRSAVDVARALLGMVFVRQTAEGRLAGRIVECEAYHQHNDAASHSARGRTPRNAVMFGPPGHLYVYFTYGMHHCMNVVCEEEGIGAAVLLRAMEPVEGFDLMRRNRMRIREAHRRPDLAADTPSAASARQRRSLLPDASARTIPDRDLLRGPARCCAAFGIDRSLSGAALNTPTLCILPGKPVSDSDVLKGPRIGITRSLELPWRFCIRGSIYVSA